MSANITIIFLRVRKYLDYFFSCSQISRLLSSYRRSVIDLGEIFSGFVNLKFCFSFFVQVRDIVRTFQGVGFVSELRHRLLIVLSRAVCIGAFKEGPSATPHIKST